MFVNEMHIDEQRNYSANCSGIVPVWTITMVMIPQSAVDRRAADRFSPQVGYSRVVVSVDKPDHSHDEFEGHAYDVSVSGLRFELDEPLEEGTPIEVELHLPGMLQSIRSTGRVVRVLDELDDVGPQRMAVTFRSFSSPLDASRLTKHLASGYFGPER